MDGYLYYDPVLFTHGYVVINSFGETLDPSTYTSYNTRLADKIRQRIMADEDNEIFRILDSIAASGNNDI